MSRAHDPSDLTAHRAGWRRSTLSNRCAVPALRSAPPNPESMKAYRLASWPELPAQFRHAAHRRILSDMSHRHLSIAQLTDTSGLKRLEVSHFIEYLEAGGHVRARDAIAEPRLARWIGQLRDRLRRALIAAQGGP
jgi:hypothetical protein